MKLVRIFRKAREHLIAELSPRHPKSIFFKYRDVVRNIPRWQEKTRGYRAHSDPEQEACRLVMDDAADATRTLKDLVDQNVTDHRLAEVRLQALLEIVDKALELLGCQFASAPTTSPTPETAEIA